MKETADVPSSEGLTSSLDVSILFNVPVSNVVLVRKTIGPYFAQIVLEPYVREAIRNVVSGYEAKALETWATLAKAWERGEEPEQFPLAAPKGKLLKSRDVFIYFINGAKERAPAAAEALLRRLKT